MQAIIIRYKNLKRWDVKYFISNLFFGENLIELSEILNPKEDQIGLD